MKLTLAQKLEKRQLKRPNYLLYQILGSIWKLLYFKKLDFHMEKKIDITKYKKEPHILLSGHASRLDYIYTGIPLLPIRYNFVSGYNEFFRSHLSPIFHLLQVIPKRNFVADNYTIKQIFRILKMGGNICLFPEGMSSITGTNQPIALGTAKLLKLCGVDVLVNKISGGYLTSTKYCLDERPGKVISTLDLLFTKEQLKELSLDEISNRITQAIHNDDFEWNKTSRIKFNTKNRVAKNIHNLLYWCPKCHHRDMISSDTEIWCPHCGNKASINEYYDLIPEGDSLIPSTISNWALMERREARREVMKEDFSFEAKVFLGTLPQYKLLKNQATSERSGEGIVRLDHEGLHYIGTKDSKPFTLDIPAQNLPTYGMCTDISFFYTFLEGKYYEFTPEENITMYILLLTEELHRIQGGKWQNFKEMEDYVTGNDEGLL